MLLLALAVGVSAEATINTPSGGTTLAGNIVFNVSTIGNNTFNMTVTNSTGSVLCRSTNGASNSTTRNCTVDVSTAPVYDVAGFVFNISVTNQTGTITLRTNGAFDVDNVAPSIGAFEAGPLNVKAGKTAIDYYCPGSDVVDTALTYDVTIRSNDEPGTVLSTLTTSRDTFDVNTITSAGLYNVTCAVTDNIPLTTTSSIEINAKSGRITAPSVAGAIIQSQATQSKKTGTMIVLIVGALGIIALVMNQTGGKKKR